MQIIQHNKLSVHKSSKRPLSDNLLSFLDETNQRFGFDNAQIYHLTHINVDEYKNIIMKTIKEHLRKMRGIGPKDKMDEVIKEADRYYEDLQNILPTSMIVFDHVYLSVTESALLFFKEYNDMLFIESVMSTLELVRSRYLFNSIVIGKENGSYISPSIQSIAYESSSTTGVFPFMSFLISFDEKNSKIDLRQRNASHHKKLELQIRTLLMGQDDSIKLNSPHNLDISKFDLDNAYIFNTRLIHNGVIIFNEYDLSVNNERAIVVDYLMPFVEDLKSQYEITDDIPVSLTKEYYDHFKANIRPVIDMVVC
jgi:hypothetical protein